MNVGEPGEEDPSKIPPDHPWREQLRRIVRDRGGPTAVEAILAPDLSKSSIEGWIGPAPCGPPSMAKMRVLESRVGYRVVDQLVDLGYVSPGEATPGISALPASVTVAMGRLESVVGELTSSRFSVWDLARAAITSSVQTGHTGRWRAKVFDVQGGSKFPHVSHHCVEFQRAHVPNQHPLGTAADTANTRKICHYLVPDDTRWEQSVTFDLTDANEAHWLERLELTARTAHVRDYMVLNAYGGEGDLHVPLINNSSRLTRHIFTDVAGAEQAHDVARMMTLSNQLATSSLSRTGRGSKVLLIGPLATNNLSITRMVADALGWPAQTVTARLTLDEPVDQDVDDLFEIHSDPRSWSHNPSRVHTDTAKASTLVRRSRERFVADGLSYWSVRRSSGGKVIGWGGCSVPRGQPWWNLTFRFRPEVWGNGLAPEMARVAISAAQSTRPDLPVLAFVMDSNTASQRTIEKLGMTLVRVGADPAIAGSSRLVYLDRDLEPDVDRAIRKIVLRE